MKKQLTIILMIIVCTLSFSETFGDWKTDKINGNKYITTFKKGDNNKFLRIKKINGEGFRITASIDDSLGRNSNSKLIFFKTKSNDANFVMIMGKFWDLEEHGKNYETIFKHIVSINVENDTSRMDIYQTLLSKFKKNNNIKLIVGASTGYNVTTEFSLVGFNKAYKYLISK